MDYTVLICGEYIPVKHTEFKSYCDAQRYLAQYLAQYPGHLPTFFVGYTEKVEVKAGRYVPVPRCDLILGFSGEGDAVPTMHWHHHIISTTHTSASYLTVLMWPTSHLCHEVACVA